MLVSRVVRALVLALVVLAGPVAWAADLEVAKPEQVGMSSERLARITAWLRADVEKGRLPGAVALVARKGRIVYFEAVGFRDKATGAPLRKDDIFRLYSMTKPLTSVAVMMLRDDGRFELGEPVSRYLPQLGKLQVGMEQTDEVTGQVTLVLEPSKREMTIQDLLRHTSGLTYGFFGTGAVKKLYIDGGLANWDLTSAELVERLGKLPLLHQPGTKWEYSHSTDVLGRLVEVVSGRTLGQFLEDRVFRPLKMTDAGFSVPRDKHGRIVEALATNPETGKPFSQRAVTAPPKRESGGGGAVSTAMDYARFSQMLLNRGRLDGVRLLGRKTVELMTADHLGRLDGPGPANGFGLGFAVRREPGMAASSGSVGEYSWSGWAGTLFWIDPREELIGIWMMQAPNLLGSTPRIFKTLVLQAIDD